MRVAYEEVGNYIVWHNLILALSILLIINHLKPEYTITGNKSDFTYIINDPIPDLLEGVNDYKILNLGDLYNELLLF